MDTTSDISSFILLFIHFGARLTRFECPELETTDKIPTVAFHKLTNFQETNRNGRGSKKTSGRGGGPCVSLKVSYRHLLYITLLRLI